MATSSTFAANPALYKSLPFDVQADFAPVTVTAFIPNLMVVNPDVPAANLKELRDDIAGGVVQLRPPAHRDLYPRRASAIPRHGRAAVAVHRHSRPW